MRNGNLISNEEALLSSHKDVSSSNLIVAKLEESEKWKNVYDKMDNENQEFIRLRCANSEKYVCYMVCSKKVSRRHFKCFK